jgi:Leucine-rich repeat (LRR) protein
MQEHLELPPLTDADAKHYRHWWSTLSDEWKKAFNKCVFNKEETAADLADEELHTLWHIPVVRFAGPRALYPNMSFELEDVSGLADLKRLKMVVVAHQRVHSVQPLAALQQLESLFVFDNQLKSLAGVENLKNLKQLYFQNNEVTSLEPLKDLTGLTEIYACRNKLVKLDGIGSKHARTLKMFRVLPNDELPQKEIIRMENKIGIRCLQG